MIATFRVTPSVMTGRDGEDENNKTQHNWRFGFLQWQAIPDVTVCEHINRRGSHVWGESSLLTLDGNDYT